MRSAATPHTWRPVALLHPLRGRAVPLVVAVSLLSAVAMALPAPRAHGLGSGDASAARHAGPATASLTPAEGAATGVTAATDRALPADGHRGPAHRHHPSRFTAERCAAGACRDDGPTSVPVAAGGSSAIGRSTASAAPVTPDVGAALSRFASKASRTRGRPGPRD